MSSIRAAGILLAAGLAFLACARPSDAQTGFAPGDPRLAGIESAVRDEIAARRIPGAVVVVGRGDAVVYRRAFGAAALEPVRRSMRADTIFDLASLTKIVATTTAVMQLVETGRLALDDPVSRHWPEFAVHGKEHITVRDLLTHHSGLPVGLEPQAGRSVAEDVVARVAAVQPKAPPARSFVYGDLDFVVLGELVRRIAGEELDAYCAAHVFAPLGMRQTGFRPPTELRERIAPADPVGGALRWGEVQDPLASRLGGVAGHAGLFSTADDLALFAGMLLRNGVASDGRRVLTATSIAAMTEVQSPPGSSVQRGLGWDIGSPFAVPWHELFGPRSYGHTGYTGTSLWVDPVSRVFVIVLTSRLHPDGRGDAKPLRARIAALVADVFEKPPVVRTGIDVLVAESFASLAGLRVALVTNQTGRDSAGRRTIDLLHGAPNVELTAIFTPEHGLDGQADAPVLDGRDARTGLQVRSLYGEATRPTPAMLADVDALVFDVQDVGVRFYTYVTTMTYAMQAAARRGIPFFVLDRPDPIDASKVQGPMLDPDLRSFTAFFPVPVRYGMTIGEVAELVNREDAIGADLRVIRMHGYRRDSWYDETGLAWVDPSPNLRSLAAATLYPGVALVEGANVSVGRGTDTPFEVMGAPWIEADRLASYLERRNVPGVRFEPVRFTPQSSTYAGRPCGGVRVVLLDRRRLDAPALGLELLAALHRLYGDAFTLDRTLGMVGARWVLRAIREGEALEVIARRWQARNEDFLARRARYLVY